MIKLLYFFRFLARKFAKNILFVYLCIISLSIFAQTKKQMYSFYNHFGGGNSFAYQEFFPKESSSMQEDSIYILSRGYPYSDILFVNGENIMDINIDKEEIAPEYFLSSYKFYTLEHQYIIFMFEFRSLVMPFSSRYCLSGILLVSTPSKGYIPIWIPNQGFVEPDFIGDFNHDGILDLILFDMTKAPYDNISGHPIKHKVELYSIVDNQLVRVKSRIPMYTWEVDTNDLYCTKKTIKKLRNFKLRAK